MSTAPPIPLPADARHQRFADLLLQGLDKGAAYLQAGFTCKPSSAQANASRALRRPDVQAYLAHVRQAAAATTVLSLNEKRTFLARIVRVPLIHIKPDNPDDPNADLVKKFKRKIRDEGSQDDPEEWIYDEFEKLDPLKAIDLDNKLSGDDPESNAITQLANALKSIGHHSPLPQPGEEL